MDVTAAWSTVTGSTKSVWRISADSVNRAADAVAPYAAPVATWWDAEAERRDKARTPETLKALMEAQRAYNSARTTTRQTGAARKMARTGSRNPLARSRRAAAVADKAAKATRADAERELHAARLAYPKRMIRRAVELHTAHLIPAAGSSVVLSALDPADWTTWPVAMSTTAIVANIAAVRIGRRAALQAAAPVEGATQEERDLLARLDPDHWVAHAADRGLDGTVTGRPQLTDVGVEAAVRLDGQWTVKGLRAKADSVRALLGARTDLPLLIAAGDRGGWGVIRLRTRSAAPDGVIRWAPGDSFGVDMVTGEDVAIPLGSRMLIAGMSGSGKSTASRPLLYDASEGDAHALVIIDLKMVEGRLWDHRARVAYTPEQVVALVAELVAELTERLEVLPKGQATLVPTAARPRITVVVDEGAEVMSSCTKVKTVVGYTEKGTEITEQRDALEGLDSIARMGRAACIDLWWMTQSPTYGDGVPRQIAKQLGTRIGLAVESPTEARVVFGESAQDKGWKADELPIPGVAMVRDGKRGPDPVKVRYLDDEGVVALPAQRIWGREEQRDEQAVTPTRLTLLKEPPAPAPDLSEADQAILAAVQELPAPVRQTHIVSRTGIPKGTVSKAVKRLAEAGHLAKTDDGALVAMEVSA